MKRALRPDTLQFSSCRQDENKVLAAFAWQWTTVSSKTLTWHCIAPLDAAREVVLSFSRLGFLGAPDWPRNIQNIQKYVKYLANM